MDATRPTTIKVQLDWYTSIEYVSLYYGTAYGLFKQRNLRVDTLPWTIGTDVVDRVSTGNADVGIVEALEFLRSVDRGQPLVAIYAFMQDTPLCLVSIRHRLESIEDLRGKRVATVRGYEYLVEYLKAKFPQIDDVEYRIVGDNVAALQSGEVDVGIFFENAQAPLLRSRGYNLSILRYEDLGFETYSQVFFTTHAFLEKNGAVLNRFFAALQQSTRETFREPAATARFFAKEMVRYSDFYEARFSDEAEYMQYQEACLRILHYYMSRGVGNNYGLMTPHRWEAMVANLRALGLLRGEIDARRVFANVILADGNAKSGH